MTRRDSELRGVNSGGTEFGDREAWGVCVDRAAWVARPGDSPVRCEQEPIARLTPEERSRRPGKADLRNSDAPLCYVETASRQK